MEGFYHFILPHPESIYQCHILIKSIVNSFGEYILCMFNMLNAQIGWYMNTEKFGSDTSMLCNPQIFTNISFTNNENLVHVEIAKCQQFNEIQN